MRRKTWVFTSLAALTLIAIAAVWEVHRLDESLQDRLKQGWFLPPIEFYSPGLHFVTGSLVDLDSIGQHLEAHDFRRRGKDDPLRVKDFAIYDSDGCESLTHQSLPWAVKQCLAARNGETSWTVIGINNDNRVEKLFNGPNFTPVDSVFLAPELMAQFYDGQPLYKEPTDLPSVPLECLQAVTAIEDTDFLHHKGVSVMGILRAIYRNVTSGHWAEGGSTITQQLVKNYFLSPKKTIRRKVTEQVLSVLLESRTSKDMILEQYLNVIFMGTAGAYQIRGFGSAARYYFGKSITQLNLPECGLLAAMVNSPGRYNPWEHPDRAKKRRELVLQKMRGLELISDQEFQTASTAPLPARPGIHSQQPAPYFLQAADRELDALELSSDHGLRIITAFDASMQSAAHDAVQERIHDFETLPQNKGRDKLQVALISVELASRHVTAVVGGRGFQQTQFNRILDGYRQIGSEAKPFVYLTAMSTLDPLSEREDTPFEYKYDRQTWTPKDYDGKYRGTVPLFLALAESLNVPAARTAIEVGIEHIAENIQKAGVDRDIPLNPSIALGAFELSPWQVAQAYSTIANFGVHQNIHAILRVETLDGQPLWEESSLPKEPALNPVHTAEVVGMMKSAVAIGTAQGLAGYGLTGPIAAKTGTTNDLKDAWFVGFTPEQLTVVWVGFDDNLPVGTGAQMALPVWAKFQKRLPASLQADFSWPEGTTIRNIGLRDLAAKYPALQPAADKASELTLIFGK